MEKTFWAYKIQGLHVLIFIIFLFSCKAQNKKEHKAESHIKFVKDRKIIISRPLSKDSFCQVLSSIQIPKSLDFKGSNNEDSVDYFFLQLYFKIDSTGQMIFLEDRNSSNKLSNEIVQIIKTNISRLSWINTDINQINSFNCKIYSYGIKDICIKSEDNFQRECYCIQ